MLKRFVLAVLGTILFFGNARVFAQPAIVINHTQMGLGTEKLGEAPACSCVDTLKITVTNNTGVTWTDYRIQFITHLDAGGPNDRVRITEYTVTAGPFRTVTINANNNKLVGGRRRAVLTLSRGMVPQGGSFKIRVRVLHDATIDVNGTPSVSH